MQHNQHIQSSQKTVVSKRELLMPRCVSVFQASFRIVVEFRKGLRSEKNARDALLGLLAYAEKINRPEIDIKRVHQCLERVSSKNAIRAYVEVNDSDFEVV